MEHLNQKSHGEQARVNREAHTSADHTVHGHTSYFERDGETYEEVSFLVEPIEKYEDDITVLNVIIDNKKRELQLLEDKLKAHESVTSSAMRMLENDIARKVAYKQGEIDRLTIIRTNTLYRIGLLSKQDRLEKGILDNLSTDVEN